MTTEPQVDRCVCHDVTFAELLALRHELDPLERLDTDAAVGWLSDQTGCTTGCGLCEPYLREALRTRCPSVPLSVSIRSA